MSLTHTILTEDRSGFIKDAAVIGKCLKQKPLLESHVFAHEVIRNLALQNQRMTPTLDSRRPRPKALCCESRGKGNEKQNPKQQTKRENLKLKRT